MLLAQQPAILVTWCCNNNSTAVGSLTVIMAYLIVYSVGVD